MRKIIFLLLVPSICYAASMSGIGDMRKSVYDSDKDGVVEYADNVSDADLGDVTITAGDWAVENADTVTNATFTTALTVNTGTLTLTADAGNDSVLTIGGGAVSVSGSNTGDDDVPEAGDFGAGTDLDANGAVAWGNLAEGELTDSTIVSADIKDGVVTEADLNATNAPGAGEDNYVLTYNHAATNFTWAADADSGAPTLDSVQSPDGATAWTLADTETIAITTSQNTAGTVLTINNSVADVTGNVYLLDLDYSVDDSQDNADYIKCQDAGGVVFSIQEDGDTLIAGTLGVTGAITGDLTGTADSVTNATLTTALTVNTGTVELIGAGANTSVLTLGAGASTVSGTNTGGNTGDNTVATSGDSATDFFGEGEIVDARISDTLTSSSCTGNAATVTGFTPASGSLTLSGADALTITTTGETNSTLPLGTKTLVATDVATLSSLTTVGTIGSLVATTADINAGTFDGVVGGTTPADGSFTTLSTSGAVDLDDAVTINESGESKDLRVESLNNTAMLVVDGSADRVGIGTAAPADDLEVANSSGASISVSLNGSTAGSTAVPLYMDLEFLGGYDTVRARIRAADKSQNVHGSDLTFSVGNESDGTLEDQLIIKREGNIELVSGQITFPATQNASADANTLDDYEEGYYTPTLTCGTSGTITIKAALNTMAYTKIGRVVHVQGGIGVDSVSSPVGSLALNLPFVPTGLTEDSDRISGSISYETLIAIGAGTLGLQMFNGTLYIIEQTTTAWNNDLSNHIQANTVLYFNFTYISE